jgi:hypothetical protein
MARSAARQLFGLPSVTEVASATSPSCQNATMHTNSVNLTSKQVDEVTAYLATL